MGVWTLETVYLGGKGVTVLCLGFAGTYISLYSSRGFWY